MSGLVCRTVDGDFIRPPYGRQLRGICARPSSTIPAPTGPPIPQPPGPSDNGCLIMPPCRPGPRGPPGHPRRPSCGPGLPGRPGRQVVEEAGDDVHEDVKRP